MSSSHNTDAPLPTTASPQVSANQNMAQIATLLHSIDEAPVAHAAADFDHENHLAQVRLGMASSLFAALRCKHAATAAHSLRVALGCSAWAAVMKLSPEDRDRIEIAALLHDVGKIGVPDSVLLKPGALLRDEVAAMARHRALGVEILQACCVDPAVLEIVGYAPAWFNGSTKGFKRTGKELPLGARMVAIVDAFDSMTTDHVYRPARSHERALYELLQCAGTQFDPDLVKHFHELHTLDQRQLQTIVIRRWLQTLTPNAANSFWKMSEAQPQTDELSPEIMFQQRLLDNMHDGVVFVNAQLQILLWNRGAERLTGQAGSALLQRPFVPSLVNMRDENGKLIRDEDCLVANAVKSGVQSLRRLMIRGRNNKHVSVDVHAIPVVSRDGTVHGATLLFHDASSEITLEERVQTLHAKATQDPLTQLANRSEFDRSLKECVALHLQRQLPCCLIICDIDKFKSINDNYGHPAGDEIIKSFSNLLKSFCRTGDIVARYGGEEFCMICTDCPGAAAYDKAEQVRKAFADLRQDVLDGRRATASFGVTELQHGDDAETLLNRADRALLQAKDSGRNMVIQVGAGLGEPQGEAKSSWWFWKKKEAEVLLERNLVTAVPLKIAVEKLRGFVADHRAQIDVIDGNDVHLHIEGLTTNPFRRESDRSVPFLVNLHFAERQVAANSRVTNQTLGGMETTIKVVIRPKKDRDRRRGDVAERAQKVLASVRSYLMAVEE